MINKNKAAVGPTSVKEGEHNRPTITTTRQEQQQQQQQPWGRGFHGDGDGAYETVRSAPPLTCSK
jgi:hypothetical protein